MNSEEDIIKVRNGYHLGDNIINFIFFYKIKDYIELNNIIIHYYCWKQYHKNVSDFNPSKNIILFDYQEIGFEIWQGGKMFSYHFKTIEDKLVYMFNDFLTYYNIPISVSEFEYVDPDLIVRYEKLTEPLKQIDILIINSSPQSLQYNYNKNEWDEFIIKLSNKYKLATTETVNNDIISLCEISVKNIAAIALKVKIIITINTGPSIPLYNTDILNNVENIYMFHHMNYKFRTRKIKSMNNLNDLSFLLN